MMTQSMNKTANTVGNAGSSMSKLGNMMDVMPNEVEVSDFKFIDFEPTAILAKKAVLKLGRIFGESPSDSSALAFMRKTRNGFEGRLHIRSAVGTFMADVIGEDPLKVLNSLSRKIRSQLRVWKRERALLA
jgi:hypothetical protein